MEGSCGNARTKWLKEFWTTEYGPLDNRTKRDWIAPIQNKVGTFTTSEIVRNILNQPKGLIDLREIMDNQKILFVKLPKGVITDTNCKLLGTLVASGLLATALSRADISEVERMPFYTYVDEFNNFTCDAFATMLDEARKYRLGLIFAHQHISQLVIKGDTFLRDAVFGNVGSLLAFQLGIEDAEFVSKYFGGDARPNDIAQLPQFTAFARLLVNGVPQGPFSVKTLPPLPAGSIDEPKKYARIRVAVIVQKRWPRNCGTAFLFAKQKWARYRPLLTFFQSLLCLILPF